MTFLRSMATIRLLAVAAVTYAVADSRGEHDIISMLQGRVFSESPGRFSPGDHVFVRMIHGQKEPGTSPLVKGSISGKGTDLDSYNIHLWEGSPGTREKLNVPAELLLDAKEAEAAELARRVQEDAAQALAKAEAEKERRNAMEEKQRKEAKEVLKSRVKELSQREAMREAKRKAEREARAAELKAAEDKREAERKAREEAEEAARREYTRKIEEAAMARKEAERQQQLADLHAKEAADRKAALKAKWEVVKAARLKAAGAANATTEVQKLVLQRDSIKKTQEAEETQTKVHFGVQYLKNKRADFTLATTVPLKETMDRAARRLGLPRDRVRFYYKNSPVDPTRTLRLLRMQNGDILEVRRVKAKGHA
mmetsp:Transcript_104949/g.306564  ORF Transcript_104949/g.306564 Transcript_104949/m.306564 type:complete len:368 (+) Transcript_104949:40-1143(+)